MIRGIKTVGKGHKEAIKGIIKKYLGVDIFIKSIRVIGGGILVECYASENNIEIMKKKGGLNGVGVWVEDDMIKKERQVQDWLEKLAKEERSSGIEVRVGYMKAKIGDRWYEWNEKEGKLIEMKFRGEGEKGRY